MTRRAAGEGWAVIRDRYGYRTGFTDPSGKRRHFRATTAKEARAKRDTALREAQHGVIAPAHRQTVAMFLRQWVTNSVAPRLSARTVERYRGIVERHIIPDLGRLPLSKLTSQHVDRLYAEKAATLSPASVRYLHAVLRGAMQQAVSYRLLAVNPVANVKPPRKPRNTIRPLAATEARALLDAASDDPLHALYLLALHTGMRLGELLALTWSAVDMGRGTLEVRATLHRVAARTYEPKEPKTERSRRTIALNAVALDELRAHRVREAERLMGLGRGMDDGSLVFTDRWGEPIYWGHVTDRLLRPLCVKAGLSPIRFHDLRHTAASMMLSSGVPVHIVSQILGHSSATTTLGTYAHLMPGDQESAVAALERALVG